jgi:hypothetical protein
VLPTRSGTVATVFIRGDPARQEGNGRDSG